MFPFGVFGDYRPDSVSFVYEVHMHWQVNF